MVTNERYMISLKRDLGLFQGCYKTVYDWIITNIVIIVAVAILGVQILGIIFAFCLCKAVGNERDFHYKY